jgi:hypothetical protein
MGGAQGACRALGGPGCRIWLEIVLEPLSPKEIQARVRAGSSAEAVAAETGWPLDKVERYAGPLLAERAYVAQLAQAVEVRRSGGAVTGVGVTLADTVARVLWDEGMIRASVAWDARRRDDGKWIVTASFTTSRGPVQASWTYDNAGRNLHPIDEAARRLMGVGFEPVDEVRAPAPALTSVHEVEDAGARTGPSEGRPHLVSLPTAPEIDADPFVDRDPFFDREAVESRLDQEERLLEQERREYELREHELREHQLRERELREHELREHQRREHELREHELREHELREHQRREQELREREFELREQQARELQAREQQARQVAAESAQSRGAAHQPTVALPREEPPNSGGKPKPKPKSRRASVPSWDEILFGATRGDES